jgi:uncharacterized protein YdeI (BOF family)
MKKLFLLLIILNISTVLIAQNHTPTAAGADGLSLGGMRVVANDVNSVFSNQAGLANLNSISFTAFGENRFALSNINQFSAGFGIPTKAGNFGLGLQYFGFEDYNEQKISVAYARKLTKRLSIGAAVDYLNLRIPYFGNQGNVTFEVGLQGQITEQITLGVHIFSPVTISWTVNDVVPTIFAMGGSYQPTDKIRIIAEVEKDFDLPVNFKAGLEYRFIEQLAARVGVNTYPIQNSFGLGIYLKKLQIDVAAVYHQVLGVTTGFSVRYDL